MSKKLTQQVIVSLIFAVTAIGVFTLPPDVALAGSILLILVLVWHAPPEHRMIYAIVYEIYFTSGMFWSVMMDNSLESLDGVRAATR